MIMTRSGPNKEECQKQPWQCTAAPSQWNLPAAHSNPQQSQQPAAHRQLRQYLPPLEGIGDAETEAGAPVSSEGGTRQIQLQPPRPGKFRSLTLLRISYHQAQLQPGS